MRIKLSNHKILGLLDSFFSQISLILSVLLFSKMLSREQFGLYGLAMSIFLFYSISESFFRTATVKYCATNDGMLFRKTISSLIYLKLFGLVVTIVAMLLMNGKIVAFYQQPDLGKTLFWFPFIMVVYTFRSHFIAVITARQNIKGLLFQDMFFAISYIGVVLCLSPVLKSAEQMFIVFFVVNCVSLLFLVLKYPSFIDIRPGISSKLARQIFNYGKYTILVGLGMVAYQNIDILMLGRMATIEDVGIYKLSRMSSVFVAVITGGVLITLMPKISLLYEQNKMGEIKRQYHDSIKHLLMIFIPFFALSLLIAEPAFDLFFKGKYAGAGSLFAILSFTGIIRAFNNPQGSLLNGIGLVKYDSFQMWGCLGLNVVLNYFLIPKYANMGAAAATIITLIVGTIIKEIYIRKYFITETKFKKGNNEHSNDRYPDDCL